MESETNAAATLDLIREGGTKVVMLAVQRLEECLAAIREGRFDKALLRCQEGQGCLSNLASAQQALGSYGRDVALVRASDVAEGMNLCHIGIVSHVEVETDSNPGSFDQDETVTLHIDNQEEPLKFPGERQLIVWTGD